MAAAGTHEPPPISVARGTAYGLTADAFTVVSALVVSIIVARFLGPSNRGVYALAVLVATLVTIVGDFGTSTSGIVFTAGRRLPRSRLHGMAVLVSLAVASLAGLLLFAFEGWLTDTVLSGVTRDDLWLVVAGIVFALYAQIVTAMLTGMGRLRALAGLRIAAALGAPVLMLAACWASGGDPFWAIAGWLGGAALLAAPMAFVATRALGPPVPPTPAQGRTILGFGLRAWIGTISHHGYLRTDVLFISARMTPADVGYYSLSSVLAERISLVGSAVYGAGASRMGAGDTVAAEALVARLVRLLLLAIVPVALLLAASAWVLIPLAFGADFRPAVLPFVLLLPGTVCLTVWYVVSLFIVAALHRPGLTTLIQGGAMLAGLPLYWVAVGAWGMTGAAIVSSSIYCSVLAAGVLVFRHHRSNTATRLLPGAGDAREAWAMVRDVLARSPWRTPHA